MNSERPCPLQATVYPSIISSLASHHLGARHTGGDRICASEGAGSGHGVWAVLSTFLDKQHFSDRSGFLALILCKVRSLVTTCIVHATLLQSCLTLCRPLDCSPPGPLVHGVLQARTLEWVAMPSSRGSF